MEFRRCMVCMRKIGKDEEICPVCGNRHGQMRMVPYALLPGSVLQGRYVVGAVIGQGGFGITYVGYDTVLEQKVAIKEYFPLSTGMVTRNSETSANVVWSTTAAVKTGQDQGFSSFLKEARKMAKLDHIPGVVGVKNILQENDTAYIIMDFIEGQTLKERLQQTGPMEFEECLALLTPVMKSLEKIHQHGIIHRDISPDNIMVQPDGSLILLDMGAAKDLQSQGASSALVAKTGFSPIEQYQVNGKIGPWTDVYAMSATIYYSCTGKLPQRAVDRLMQDTLSLQPNLTDEQFQVLRRGMAIHCQDRFQSMPELLGALKFGTMAVEPDLDIHTTVRVQRRKFRRMRVATVPVDGTPVLVELPMNAELDQEICYPGKGLQWQGKRGDLYVTFQAEPEKNLLPLLFGILAVSAAVLAGLLFLRWELDPPAPPPTAPMPSTTQAPTVPVTAPSTVPTTAPATVPTAAPSTVPTTVPVTIPTTVPTTAPNPLRDLRVGSVFTFGSFEQDDNAGNGQEPIVWIVLEKQEDRILVISQNALDSQRYHYRAEDVTWSNCSIRTWLNGVFFSAAFTPEEQNQILDVRLDGGWETDKVFCLSLSELNQYFYDNNSRICRATTYAVHHNAYVNGTTGGSWWLLRTVGTTSSRHVMSVNADGVIDYGGGRVESDRGVVRPAMWLDIR